uniref:Tf2-1-like SH3-like domain-containing protein n=1 Tax=Tanacetum cinerariifolium TaxID=118510 RepID=A0A6L2JGG4_TANCI|nr:hypothetical protein [Tanacetum cinerariifolium]
MLLRMTTRSVGRATATPQGGRIDGRTGRGSGRTRGRSGDQGNVGIDGQIGGQGNEVNVGVDGFSDFFSIISQQLQKLLPTILAQVGNQGSNQGNPRNQNGNVVNDNIQGDVRNVIVSNNRRGCTYKGLLACNLKEYDRKGEAAVGMSWEDFKILTREEFFLVNEMQKLETKFWNRVMVEAGHAAYTDRFHELTRNGSLKKNPDNRGNGREPNRDRNARDKNKRTRTGNAFATTTNSVRREYNGTIPKLNQAQRPSGNRPNQVVAINGGQGHRNNGNQARRRAFMLGAEEARQDPNIMMGIEPSELGFSYEIEIASGQLVEIDKVIRGCKLEIEDWLSNYKAEIIYYEKVVRIPLQDGQVLRVMGERPKEKMRHLMSAKAKEQKLKEIVVVREFPEKCKTFDWGEEQESAFQTLKDKLCNAPILALLNRLEDFVHRWIKLFSDYDCKIRYHPGKENVVADVLSRKERVKPKRIQAINMTLQSSIKDKILAAQEEASDEPTEMQRGMDELMKCRSDGVKTEHQRLSGLLQQLEILEWKWERIAMDFVTNLPRTTSGHDAIWVIVDRLTKSDHFLPMREDYKIDRLARLYLNEIVARHGVSISIISDHDNRFTSRLAFAAICKNKGVTPVAYRIRLPEGLNGVHDMFHVSNLKKCLADPTLQVPLDEIQLDAKLNFVEEPIEILER